MATEQLYHWLTLFHAKQLTAKKLNELLDTFSSVTDIVNADHTILSEHGLAPETIHSILHPNEKLIDQDLQWASKPDCHFLFLTTKHYPYLLTQIPDPPLMLYVRGKLEGLKLPQIAIVGSRNPTCTGKENAFQFAHSLSLQGFGITSGLALGIDAAAHRGALSNQGNTLGILGSGLENLYPKQHAELALQILDNGGAILSEFALHTPPRAWHFPLRNRIISGISLGIIVVEAALQSGSLITARLAAEQGREVFVMPGSIHNPLAKGCHQLLKKGAKLTETTEDVIEELIPLMCLFDKPVDQKANKSQDRNKESRLDQHAQLLLDYFGYEVTSIDQVVKRSGLSVSEVSAKLLLLEVKGYIRASPGGYMRVD